MKMSKETGEPIMTLEDWLLFLEYDPYVELYDVTNGRTIWSGDSAILLDTAEYPLVGIDQLFAGLAAAITEFSVEIYSDRYGIKTLVNVNLEGKGIK